MMYGAAKPWDKYNTDLFYRYEQYTIFNMQLSRTTSTETTVT